MQIMLAIETSQREGSVALRDQQGTVHLEQLQSARRHDDDLLPAIDRLMARCGLKPSDLSSVAVSVGPGGFTGLRIAVTTAKMFAEALKVHLVAVPSALVAAEGTPGGALARLVALAGKADTFWATMLQRPAIGEPWQIIGEPALMDHQQMPITGIDEVLADDHLPAAARQVCEQAGLSITPPQFSAEACLRVAQPLLEARGPVDPLYLVPIYPRQPEAVSLWQARKDA